MSSAPADPLSRLASLCHQAAAAPDRWPDLVTAVHERFSTSGTVLFTPEAGPADAFGVAHGAVANGVEEYFGQWLEQDAWNVAVVGRSFFRTAGEVRQGHEFLADAALRRTDFFNAWGRRFEAERVMSLKVEDGAGTFAPVMHLSLFRRFADAPFSAQEAQALKALWPHLRLAAQALWSLRSVRQTAAQEGLDALPLAAWVLREDGRIEYANRAAGALMRQGSAVAQSVGYLTTLGNLEADALSTLMRRAALTQHMEAVAVRTPGQLRAALLRLVPIREAAHYGAVWPRSSLLLMLDMPHEDRDTLWMEHLCEYHRFTRAQRVVLECLKSGMTVQDIATSRGIKEGTVRSHVHALLEKTGLERQIDLVRLALGVRTLQK